MADEATQATAAAAARPTGGGHPARVHGSPLGAALRERVWQEIAGAPGGAAAALVRAGEELLLSGGRPVPGPLGELAGELGAAGAYSFLLDRHLDRHLGPVHRRAAPALPGTAALMAALAGPAATVLDPVCGSGALLAAALGSGGRASGALGPGGRARPARLYGQEADPHLARLAALRLALLGATAHVRTGDALRGPAPGADGPGVPVDAVLCRPPSGERDWGYEELAYDPRWEYGLPARAESELAWAQHCLSRLRPGGTAVLLMPSAAASRRTGRRVRAALLRRGALRAVVALPAAAARPDDPQPHLWVLRRPGGPEGVPAPAPRLLLVDAGARRRAGEERRTPPREEPYRTVLDAWRAFERRGDVPGEPGFSACAAVIGLLDERVDVSPARHVPAAGRAATPG
ncbi:SAM-dependent methyltransferase [Streptomyces sp. S1A]|uniref:N-6 DNA methylase n=1 Tax=Streptomyces sp. ICN903 TaxID=2964654 RepID=UPI001EDC5746|nr:N-6 DNA methylase [Streptomyces sp. ICN903]MCG3042962.1 SAM-dependent methyltransferase [Streptomyces sp. ICN903]